MHDERDRGQMMQSIRTALKPRGKLLARRRLMKPDFKRHYPKLTLGSVREGSSKGNNRCCFISVLQRPDFGY